MSNVLISLVSEYDNKGFKQADTSIKALTKRLVKLSTGYLTLRNAQKSVNAALADDKAIKVLSQNLKNLGFGFATTSSEKFVQELQRQTGVLDDELRPAYAQLARVTGSITKTQNLLIKAFDISSGSGKDYTEVVNALSQAYVGNYKGLKSLNIGLTQAEMKGKSFNDIMAILDREFAGAGAAALESYGGKMQLLKAAAADASETIGYSLVDALQMASGSNGIGDFIKKIDSAAGAIAKLIDLAGIGARAIGIFVRNPFGDPAKLKKQLDDLYSEINKREADRARAKTSMWIPAGYKDLKTNKEIAKLEANRLALLKKQTNEKRSQAALDKANALIAKANEMFDLEGIQLAAALANKGLSDDERKRLEIKQAIYNLEQALLQNDMSRIDAATALLAKLLSQYEILGKIKSLADELGANIELIDLTNLTDALATLTAIKKVITSGAGAAALASATSPESMAWTAHESQMAKNRRSVIDAATNTSASAAAAASNPSPVTVTVTDNATKIVDVVVDGLTNLDASGISTRILRNTGGLNW